MAKDVITRFKLETTGFDSKIKQAAKDLSAYSKTATQAKEGFDKFTKANIDAAKALGTMATSTTNAKDRAKELVGAFNDAAKAYNSLTKEQQQSDWAKALAGSLTQLQQRIKETKEEMQGLSNTMKGDTKGGIFDALGGKMSGALAVFGGNLMTKAAGAVAQLGSEMADMVKQGVEMAKAGEGVRIAFERLGNGQILDGLREATHGTVTDIELMKAAVKFNDFKLPLDELGTMLAFAQQKAKDTGQSVDYMVDSIVTGLGRKSLMILDNLGLSATEVRERMKETGDMTKAVGSIIRDQMAKAGDYVETAADRAAQANVTLQNKMEELGRKFAPVEEASNQLWTSMKIGILDIIGGPLAKMLNQLTEAGRLKNALNNLNGEDGSGNTKVGQQLSALRGSNYKNAKYKSQLAQYDKQIDTYQRMIDNGGKLPGAPAGSGKDVRWLRSQMDALKAMRSEYVQGAKEIMKPVETNIKTDKSEQNIKTLTAQLKELEKQRKEAVKKGDQEQVEALTKQISQVKTNLGYLDPNAVKTGKTGKKNIQYADDSIMAQEKLVSDLTQKWKTASGELREGYLKDLEDAQKKLAEMTGKAKGPDLDAMFPDMSKENYNTGYAGSAQAKYDSARADLALGPMNFDAINNYIGSIKGMMKDANLGDELYTSMTEKLKDATTFSTLLQEAMTSGVSAVDLSSVAQELKRKLLEGDIDEDAWQQFLEQINEKIENSDLKLKIDVNTGDVSKQSKEMAKNWQAAGSAIQAVGNAMQQIEDPAAKVMGTIAQAVATMALSYSQAAASPAVTGTGWGWIAFAATGIATMLSSIAAIKQATAGFSNGGVIPGNSMSGDNLRGITPDGTVYGLNSQEIILNRAQQGNLASQLEGGGMENLQLDTVIGAEDIRVVLNNRGRRTGRGEYVQSRKYNG